GLGVWVVGHLPSQSAFEHDALAAENARNRPGAAGELGQVPPAAADATSLKATSAVSRANAAVNSLAATSTLTVGLAAALPADLQTALGDLRVGAARIVTTTADDPTHQVLLSWEEGGEPVYHQVFAAATRFDAIDLSLRMLHVRRAWEGNRQRFDKVVVLRESVPALESILGDAGRNLVIVEDMAALLEETNAGRNILALVPFDRLMPQLAVFAVDGQTPVENATKFNPTAYPLVATLYATTNNGEGDVAQLAAAMPATNRDPSRLTVVAMTGVTAMVRLTAEQMDERGPAWPAEVVGPELATADITAISNEVPFVPDCETNTDPENLVFCSKPEYMETLRASGDRKSVV